MRQATSAAPRRGTRRIIERPRLLKLLEGASARTILLVAPAGFGKTTLARQWAARHDGIHWYSARSGSADIAQLAVELATVFAGLSPGLEEYVSQLVRARPSPAKQAVEIVDGFAGAADAVKGATLVVDDFHLIAEDDVAAQFVYELQQKLDLRLVVASRVRPSWAAARLEIYGDSVELGAEELALTDDEAHEILGRSARAGGLVGQSRGWPAVVALAAQAGEGAASPPDAADATLFRFFAEELFLATPVALQEKLVTLALLPTLAKPIVEGALGSESEAVIEAAIESGLAGAGPDGAELHPLVREYLLTKLRGRADAGKRIRAAFELSLDAERWDHAFELTDRLGEAELLTPLVERSFKALLSSGRVTTLERIAAFAHASGADSSPLVGLIDAELAFRNGFFARAEVIAERAARELGSGHMFESHAWWVAGHAALLSLDEAEASDHFQMAQHAALTDEDVREALWGRVITSCQAEDASAAENAQPLLARRDGSPVDRIRATAAEIHLDRVVGSGQTIKIENALHALDLVGDPRICTSFMNACAYHLTLRADYDRANVVAERMLETVEAYQLNWARPHAHWALAAAALGRREFATASMWLRRVEHAADTLRFGPLLLNASCLRARMLLALGHPGDALSALAVDETVPVNRGMRGEFLATKAMVHALMASPLEAEGFASEALAMTRCVEARAYAACSRAITAQLSGEQPSRVTSILADVEDLGVWDALVSAIRAYPLLLTAFLEGRRQLPSGLHASLRRSRDFDLARRCGVDLGRRPRGQGGPGTLSPREIEVLDLVREGLTNADIARALFISESTVKVHVRHILEKTGARSRTEAAASLNRET